MTEFIQEDRNLGVVITKAKAAARAASSPVSICFNSIFLQIGADDSHEAVLARYFEGLAARCDIHEPEGEAAHYLSLLNAYKLENEKGECLWNVLNRAYRQVARGAGNVLLTFNGVDITIDRSSRHQDAVKQYFDALVASGVIQETSRSETLRDYYHAVDFEARYLVNEAMPDISEVRAVQRQNTPPTDQIQL
jgi:hypothetical protein